MTSPPAVAVLVVDDEPIVLSTLRATLERAGYQVVACAHPHHALALLEQRPFAAIISDQQMPGMTGLDFFVECRRMAPDASRILMTGVLDLCTIVDAINRGEIYRFVTKPWLREELLATVRTALQRHALILDNRALQAETMDLNGRLAAANAALENKVTALEEEHRKLDAAHGELALRYDHSLELCRRILATYDPVLGGQAKALIALVTELAAVAPCSPAERHALESAARLCDLGLIGVSRELLHTFRTRPDELTEAQRNLLHLHPVHSQTIAALVDPRSDVGETIRSHHERFDGSGYPDGLAGDAIPWPARCLAVAVDFVECGLPAQAATDRLLALSGRAHDPAAVHLLLEVVPQVRLPRQVREVRLDELAVGMVLASGIYSPHGLLLAGEGQALGPSAIGKIRSHHEVIPIGQRLLVYS